MMTTTARPRQTRLETGGRKALPEKRELGSRKVRRVNAEGTSPLMEGDGG